MRNQTKLKETLTGPVEGEQVCLKDSKYILSEIPENQTWKDKLLLAKQALFRVLAGSASRSLYGPSMSDFLGFQTKYIWNP